MNYFLQRLLLFIPTLFILSILIFLISQLSPTNPSLAIEESSLKNNKSDFFQNEQKLKSIRHSMGIDYPSFYFNLCRITASDTLYKIDNHVVRNNISHWSFDLASWSSTNYLFAEIKHRIKATQSPSEQSKLIALLYEKEVDTVLKALSEISDFNPSIELTKGHNWYNFIPVFHWYGLNNQYHHWISSVVRLDLGRSTISKENIDNKLKEALLWTLSLSLCSLVLSLLVAIPLAVLSSQNPNGLLDRFCSITFFSLYSMPVFWVASLLLIYFASIENFHWFPSYGVGEISSNMSWFEIIQLRISHLSLPIVCWTYGSLAFIYRQLRSKLEDTLSKEFILTARAKGLKSEQVVWKHAFRNSRFPLITLLGASLPALITGSFIIESIFSIPGMGKLTIDAFLQRDYPLIYNLSLIACFFTVLGMFLADIAYHYSDPRIKYSENV